MMKRLTAMVLALLLLVTGADCTLRVSAARAETNSLEAAYLAAAAKMVAGEYEAAAVVFASLSGYGDAPQMAIYCRGLALLTVGDFARAEKAFAQLGTFKDAAVWVIACQGMALQAEGEQLMAAGSPQGYRDCPALLEAAAECYDRIDYLPEMAARAKRCRELAVVSGFLHDLPEMENCVETGRKRAAERAAEACKFSGVYEAAYGLCVVMNRSNCRGVVNARGRLVVPCEWETISIDAEVIVAYGGGRFAVFTHTGGVILEGEGTSAERIGQAVKVCREENYGIVSLTGDVVLPCEYDSVRLEGSVYVMRRDARYGVATLTGEIILPCEWAGYKIDSDAVLRMSNGSQRLGNLETRYVLTDAAVVLPEGVTSYERLAEDVMVLWGAQGCVLFRISAGVAVIVTEEVFAFGDGFIVVEDNETAVFTWYDADLNVQTPPEGATPGLGAGLWVYQTEDGGWYLTDLQGRKVLEGDDAENVQIEDHDGGFTALTMPVDGVETCFLMDTAGNIVLITEKVFKVFDGEYAHIGKDGGEWIADLTAGVRTALPQEHGRVGYLGQGLFQVRVEAGRILLHAAQGWLGETCYDSARRMSAEYQYLYSHAAQDAELVLVCRGDLYGVVDLAGEEVLPCDFEQVGLYRDDLLLAVKDGKYGLFNLAGEEVVPCQFSGFINQDGPFVQAYQRMPDDLWDVEYTVFNLQAQLLFNTRNLRICGSVIDVGDGCLYNASGEAVYEVDRADSWSAGGGYIFAVEDGLLTVYDETGACIY